MGRGAGLLLGGLLVATVADPVAVSADATEIWISSQGPGVSYRRPLAGGALELGQPR